MSDHERLLAEVLAENEPAVFHAELLDEVLQLAGRRRRNRRRRPIVVAAIFGAIAVFAARSRLGTGSFAPAPAANYVAIQTAPLAPNAIIHTPPSQVVTQVLPRSSVAWIHTTPTSGQYRNLSDNELLALAAPRAVALVRIGPHAEKLIFLNPADSPLN